jgi:UDP-N-acetylmuramyl pentapeptide phosphotransferase/UDP-N-acetylglucosamine-1-phosphate transferase
MSFILMIILTGVSAFLVNLLFTKWFIHFAERKEIFDIPIERSSHTRVTPRGGGAGFVIVTLTASLVYLIFSVDTDPVLINGFYLVAALLGISLLGWFDDMGSLLKRVRFTVQIICGLTVLLGIGTLAIFYIPLLVSVEAGIIGTLLGLIWITGTTNIYNFMDGVDGIAGMQGVIAAISWAVFGWVIGFELIVVMNLVLLAALLAFLRFNWSPASIFMGDVGSVFLGFWFASMPFLAMSSSTDLMIGEVIWFAAFVIWPFLFDGSFTIARRYKQGENVLDAHRSHLYQRLNIAGFSHKHIALLYACFAIICSVFAFLFLQASEVLRFISVATLFILSMGYAYYVQKTEERASETVQN